MLSISARLGQAIHKPLPARPAPLGNDLTAIGLSMEGIHRNYLTIDYVLQGNWGRSPGLAATDACNAACNPNGCPVGSSTAACDASLRGWASTYGRRRYGTAGGAAAVTLWKELYDVAYSASTGAAGATTALFAARPTMCITPCSSGPGAAGIPFAGDKSIARHQAVCSVAGSDPATCGCQCPPAFKANNRSTWGVVFDANNATSNTVYLPAWRQIVALGAKNATFCTIYI
jgi:hypothetical protein